MRKTRSDLKGLAETRARVAGDLLRHQKRRVEFDRKLEQAKADFES